MLVAPQSPNEESRLEALLRYKVLDTEAEGPYDDLVALASHICEKPIALISLVDDHRQWFKAKVGLDAEETPRDIAFCAHAILQEEVFQVSNALEDERFADNPLVAGDPDIRFYAGTPLVTHDGHALGTLCVIDRIPGELTHEQENALKILGRQVISQLDLRLNNEELKSLNTEKDAFIRLLSHDLRSAFAAITGFSNLILKRAEKQELEAAPDLAQKIKGNAEQGVKLLDSLVSWSRLQGTAPKLESNQFDVFPLCEDVIEYLRDLANTKDVLIKLECPSDLKLSFDASLFRSVIQNLLHNAIKFSNPSGKVSLKLLDSEQRLLVSVQDDGIGMSQEGADKLFSEHFLTTEGTAGEVGSGIGTQLISDFVNHHNGKIKVDTELNQGTTITISLPK